MQQIVECTAQHPRAIQNSGGFCRLDGTCFDVGGHCAHGHAQDAYFYPLSAVPLAHASAHMPTMKIECTVLNINFADVCSICGTPITDPVIFPLCQRGHEIGTTYEVGLQ